MNFNLRWAGLLALGSGLTGTPSRAEAGQPLPAPFPEARYQQMSAKSPFAVATAASATTAAPTPGFAEQLYVDGVAHIGQKDFVAIKSKDPAKPVVIFLEVGQSTEDGMKIERVEWSDETGKSMVDVSKGAEKATLVFDEQQMAKAATSVPAPNGQLQLQGTPGLPDGIPSHRRRLIPKGH